MLYIVSTPIGNLEDITLRAISALNSSDIILAEDTRVTRVLLSKYGIDKPLISYHQHSKVQKINEIINLLKDGKTLSLVSDAGTPGINDPGNYLIQEILKELPDLKIVPIPGPNAAITALSVSGFPADRFVFLGFPPHKKGRQTFFKRIGELEETVVFYESKHRILKALEELRELSMLNDRPIMVARELTKQFETIYRGTVSEILEQLNKTKILGEFVLVIRTK
ncbi:MAG: 16S rRNA (cytidine(1402)-2'-O)-methyltransferase [Candidatus Yanofskybacteria bacterium]|nr:16S rRNA (cytidine(1402)-2'-O)-methyltransferase [Candidatus Yanofskybacteria bacterium]